MCMARLNVRIRTRLFDSLLSQELGYFDTTKTGVWLMFSALPFSASWKGAILRLICLLR